LLLVLRASRFAFWLKELNLTRLLFWLDYGASLRAGLKGLNLRFANRREFDFSCGGRKLDRRK